MTASSDGAARRSATIRAIAEMLLERPGWRGCSEETMRMIAKLAPLGTLHQRFPLSDIIDQVRRAWSAGSDRKATRRLQDIDSWSDQAEVAYYEDCRAVRCS